MSEGVTKASSDGFYKPRVSSEHKHSSEQRKQVCDDNVRDAKRHRPRYNSIVVPR